jgi:hypothetical protein
MNSGTLDGGREPREGGWSQWQWPLEPERLPRLFGRKESEGNFGGVTFLAPEARPERGINNRFDSLRVRLRSQVLPIVLTRRRKLAGKMCLDRSGDCSSGGV